MRNLIIPCCGRNFLNGKPKYLNEHPDGQLLAIKTFQELNISVFDKVYYVILREDVERYNAISKISEAISLQNIDYKVIMLDERTDGPAETVYRAIVEEKITGEIVIKDLDNMLGTVETVSGNFVAGLNLIEYEKDVYDLRKKSFVILNEQNIVLDIVEKRLCSDVISAGLYGFENADDFIFSYEKLQDKNYGIRHLYVSHVISYLIGFLQQSFNFVGVSKFESWGTEKEWNDVLQEYGSRNKSGLLIIDLDGTLIDTNSINYHAYKKALKLEGYDVDFDYFRKYCNGYSYKRFLPEIIGADKADVMERIHDRKLSYYSDYLNEGRVNTFLVDTIRAAGSTKNVALVTTASRDNTYEILEFFNLTDLFDRVYTAEDVSMPKPDPEGFLKAVQDFNVSVEDVIVFEDSDVGVEAALNVGALCYKICSK